MVEDTTDDIVRACRLLDNEIRILKEELQRTNLELDYNIGVTDFFF
jgi:hypothetical protein